MIEETKSEFMGKVQTVLGVIEPEALGITLTHEHFLFDARFYFEEPSDPKEKELAYQPVTLANLNWCIHHHHGNLDALVWDDEQLTIQELMPFKEAGGNTILEATTRGFGRNPQALKRISQATGISVIMTTGYYVAASHPPSVKSMSEEEVAEELVREVTVGVDDTEIRAGFLKAACGNSPKIEADERKVMRACVIAQRHTGAPMGVHNTRPSLIEKEIEILGEAGANFKRTIFIHSGEFEHYENIFPKILQTGCYIQFDTFGSGEVSVVPHPGYAYLPNDSGRCDMILQLIEQGYLERILISQDTYTKPSHVSYGGTGYAHILLNAVPLMRQKGISDEQIHTMMVENPKRLLQFV